MPLARALSFRLGALAALAVDGLAALAVVVAAVATTSVGLRFPPWVQLKQSPLALAALRLEQMPAATLAERRLLDY
jgi:hypothetical protein